MGEDDTIEEKLKRAEEKIKKLENEAETKKKIQEEKSEKLKQRDIRLLGCELKEFPNVPEKEGLLLIHMRILGSL